MALRLPTRNPNIPTIPQPLANVDALVSVVVQIRQGLESLGGMRGDPLDRAVTVRELQTVFDLAGLSGFVGVSGPAGPPGPAGPAGPTGPPGADLSGGGTMSGPLTVFDTGAVYSPTQIYHMAYPQAVFNDAIQGSEYVSVSYAGTQRAGIAGYVVTDFTVNRGVGWGNGVAVMGVGVAHSNGAMAWGINTLLTDSDNPVVVTGGTGRLLQNEFDFNVTSANTETYGLTLGGASVAQPTVANGFVVNILGAGIHWQSGFISTDAAANNGLVLGYQGATSGVSLKSQPVILHHSDSGGARQSVIFQAQGNNELAIFGTTALSVRITGDLHVSGTIGTLSALETRVAALEQRLAAAGL